MVNLINTFKLGLVCELEMVSGLKFQSEKTRSILKIRAKLLCAARCWLNQHDYVEVHGPTIIPAVGDWPGYFEVKYFDKKAYLCQGLQPYANAFVASLGKIYTIAPTFRAEKFRTKRHLTEYWRVEVAQQCDMDTIVGVQEELVAHICQSLSKEARRELKSLRCRVEDLAKVHTPFPRLTYDEVIDMLQKEGFNISWGQQLYWEVENYLSLGFDRPFFITEFPVGVQTFFYKSHPKRMELTLSVDLLAPEGYGEIGGGGQMITEKEVLLKKMAAEKIETGDQQWYLGLMQYDPAPQSVFAMGLERLIQWICKLVHIKDASAFPRLSDGIYP
jgi:asparaginyl-tRNA synthetase